MQEGSVLGVELFNTFINNMDQGVKEMLNTLADNTKLGEVANTWEGRGNVQRDFS